jgi:Dihydroprymidine dehydrogenase domain II, 4Fe-4S cluster/ABC transporter substrate binding protein
MSRTTLETHYVSFGGARVVKAVNRVSFAVNEGETLGIDSIHSLNFGLLARDDLGQDRVIEPVTDMAIKCRLPAASTTRAFADIGGLMSFGADGPASVRHGAKFVQRILQGRQPNDLPIEQPTKFELAINPKTAKATVCTSARNGSQPYVNDRETLDDFDPEGHDPGLQGHDRQGHERDAVAAGHVCRSLPPCNNACPAGVNIQVWLSLAQAGRYEEAWRKYMDDNPLPATHGRACYHPCENACNRQFLLQSNRRGL